MIRAKNLLKVALFAMLTTSVGIYAQSGCNANTFLTSGDPNTIEYDNLLSNFHSTLVREANGDVKTWGENAAADGNNHLLTPTIVNAANGFSYTGTILRTAVGSNYIYNDQFALLTSTGLYVWGVAGNLVSTNIKSGNNFGTVSILTYGGAATNTNGLPDGVTPSQVKMLFGSHKTLAIVTTGGAGYILSDISQKNGDGTTTNDHKWHRIKKDATTNLDNIVAIRGVFGAMMALTSDGNIYTWGTGAYLGDTNNKAQRNYAALMSKPTGVTGVYPTGTYIKTIGMTTDEDGKVSYYVLASDGLLYSLGENNRRQLGDFTTTERKSWVNVKKSSSANLDNVGWFSPQEHDKRVPAVNALTNDGKIYAWGQNGGRMLAQATLDDYYNPVLLNNGTSGIATTDVLMAVETGGHTTMVIKKCTFKFGYVGHRVNGSMGDGTTVDAYENDYNFANTPPLNLCGAATVPAVVDLKICPSTTANINTAFVGTVPLGQSLHWYTTTTRAPGSEIVAPFLVGPGTYYAFFEGDCPNPPYSTVHVTYYVPSDPGYASCICHNAATIALGPDTPIGITNLKRAGAGNGNWPMIRKSGFIAIESNASGFVITRRTTSNISGITNPVEGMMVFDTTAKCLKIYSDSNWKCFSTPACPN